MPRRSQNTESTSSSMAAASSSTTTAATSGRGNVHEFKAGDIVLCVEKPARLVRKIQSKKGKWEVTWFGYDGFQTRHEKDFFALHKDDQVKEPRTQRDIFRVQMPIVLELLGETPDGWGSEAGRTKDMSKYLLQPRANDVNQAGVIAVAPTPPVSPARAEDAIRYNVPARAISFEERLLAESNARKRAGSQLNGTGIKKSRISQRHENEQPSGWFSSFGNPFRKATNWVCSLFWKQ